jgi:NAD(P)H-dependent FMN reductase
LPLSITKLYDLIQSYDSIVIASPEHNGLPSAFLKNTLDWLSRNKGQKFFQDKKVVLLSTSPGGTGGASSLAKLKEVIPFWGATVVGTHSLGGFFDKVDSDDNLNYKEDQEAIKAVLELL